MSQFEDPIDEFCYNNFGTRSVTPAFINELAEKLPPISSIYQTSHSHNLSNLLNNEDEEDDLLSTSFMSLPSQSSQSQSSQPRLYIPPPQTSPLNSLVSDLRVRYQHMIPTYEFEDEDFSQDLDEETTTFEEDILECPPKKKIGRPKGSKNKTTTQSQPTSQSQSQTSPSSQTSCSQPTNKRKKGALQTKRVKWDLDDILQVARTVYASKGTNMPKVLENLKKASHRIPDCTETQITNLWKRITRANSPFRQPFKRVDYIQNPSISDTENQRAMYSQVEANNHNEKMHNEVHDIILHYSNRQNLVDTEDQNSQTQLKALREMEEERDDGRNDRSKEFLEKTTLETEYKQSHIAGSKVFCELAQHEMAATNRTLDLLEKLVHHCIEQEKK